MTKKAKKADGMIEVESGVPLPAKIVPLRVSKYPFATMAVGDCFFVPVTDDKPKASRITSSASGWCRQHNPKMRFATRTMPDDRVGCWRVK